MTLRHFTLHTLLLMITCASSHAQTPPQITQSPWGKLPDGRTVTLFTLKNSAGMEARIMDYGGTVVSLTAPDRNGQFADVVLGFDSLDPYLAKHPFFGTITGRYANRIGGAAFTLEGTRYEITANSGKNHIHGGKFGFDKKLWTATSATTQTTASLTLRYTSPDGEEGFPGTLQCSVTYSLNNDNSLQIDYRATTDAPTVINLTNHSYFNLAGEGSGSALNHTLQIPATHITATDDEMIATGQQIPITGTPMDFSSPHLIGERIEADFPPMIQGKGYDHNYILPGDGLKLAAIAHDPASGRSLTVRTTEPGVQLYTANHLKNIPGKSGHIYNARDAFCLETQHWPNSPNQPDFPTTALLPGDTFLSTTRFEFSAQ
jgi:aldose 1-epimerase